MAVLTDASGYVIVDVGNPSLEELKQRHNERTKELQDTSIPYKKVTTYLDSWVQKNFKQQGALVGGWIPFKAGGRVRNGKVDTSAQLLMDTGRLRASFLPFVTKSTAGIGSDLPYSKAHNEGEGAPKRRILPVDGEVKKQITDILEGRVNEVYKK